MGGDTPAKKSLQPASFARPITLSNSTDRLVLHVPSAAADPSLPTIIFPMLAFRFARLREALAQCTTVGGCSYLNVGELYRDGNHFILKSVMKGVVGHVSYCSHPCDDDDGFLLRDICTI